MQTLPDEFFAWSSILTLSGAAAATFLISNMFQRAFDYNPKWLALAIAQFISFMRAMSAGYSHESLLMGIINGFLIYAVATGTTSIGNAVIERKRLASATPAG